MKLIKNLLKTLTVALCGALVLASCKGAIDNPGKETAYLRATANSSGRSALFPVYELSDFDSYTLLGTYAEDNYVTPVPNPDPAPYCNVREATPSNIAAETIPVELGSWESYDDFANAYIAIPETGKWNFTLNAYTSEGTYFSAKKENIEIGYGANSINFLLKAKEYATGDSTQKGGFSVSFGLDGAPFTVESNNDWVYNISNPDYSVSATVKKGVDLADAVAVSTDNLSLELVPVFDQDGNEKSNEDRFGSFSGIQNFTGNFLATIEKENLDSGYYWVTFSVNKGTLKGIITKTVFVTVADGKITTEEDSTSITEIVRANDVLAYEEKITFAIDYDFDGGTILDEDGYTPPTSYCSRDTKATVLPTENEIARDGYIFLGWKEILINDSLADEYTTQLLSDENHVVEGDREYKAIWKWDSTQTITIAKNGENGTYASQTFSWNTIPGADGYRIYSKESENADWNYLADITTTSYFTIPSFNSNKYYAVKAYNSDEDVYSDDFSNEVVYTQISALAEPSVIKTDDTLTWAPVYGATEYRIYKCESEISLTDSQVVSELSWNSSDTDDTIASSQELSYVLVPKFEKYVYFVVKAYNSVYNEISSYTQVFSTPKSPAPVITYSNGTLSWNPVNEATGYIIYSYATDTNYNISNIATVKDYLSTEITKDANVTSYNKENLSSLNYLYLAVKAKKYPSAEGTTAYTDYSNIITIAPKDFTPPELSVENSDTQGDAVIVWDEVEGASGGYKIYYWATTDTEVTAENVIDNGYQANTTSASYTIHKSSPTKYWYVVVAPYSSYDSQEGDASNVATIAPLNLSFADNSSLNSSNTDTLGTKRISWDEVEDATGYRVYYYSSSAEPVSSETIVLNNTYHDTENTYYDFTNTSTSNYLYIAVRPYFYSSYYEDTYYGTASSVCQIDYIHLPNSSSSVEPVSLSWSNSEGKAYISFSETADYTYIYKYSSASDLALDTFDTSLTTELYDVCSSASNYEITLPAAGTYDYYFVRNGDDNATSESYSNVIKVCSNISALQESHSGTYYFTETSGTWTSNNYNHHSQSAISTWQTSTDADMIYYSCNWEVSSESNFDKLTITQNGTTKVNAVSGSNFGTISGYISGDLVIEGKYQKDTSQNAGSDCGTLTFTQLYLFFD